MGIEEPVKGVKAEQRYLGNAILIQTALCLKRPKPASFDVK